MSGITDATSQWAAECWVGSDEIMGINDLLISDSLAYSFFVINEEVSS